MGRHHVPSLRALVIPWWALVLREGGRDIAAAQGGDFPDCEGDAGLIGDAICDFSLNVATCGYDGGDCCACSCEDTADHECGKDGTGFFCVDPDVPIACGPTVSPTPGPTASPSSLTFPGCSGYTPYFQDGYCDSGLNNADCEWDGGDCCECTCLEGLEHECGNDGIGFDCRDPDAPSACDSSGNSTECEGNASTFQDGACDDDLNNADCEWDGGDCCVCTCREFDGSMECGSNGYDCRDPLAPTECDSWASLPVQQTSAPSNFSPCTGLPDSIADGYCDESNNNAQCAWDGGDCCACTCVPATFYCDSDSFDCQDPGVAHCTSSSSGGQVTEDDEEDEDSGSKSRTWNECPRTSDVGNGFCDFGYNTPECSWDGGDCCECTCAHGLDRACGENGYNCLDPNSDGFCAPPTPSPYAGGSSRSLSGRDVVFMFLGSVVAFACFLGALAALLAVVDRMIRPRVSISPAAYGPKSGRLKDEGIGPPLTSLMVSAPGSLHRGLDPKQVIEGGDDLDVGQDGPDWKEEGKCCADGEDAKWGADGSDEAEERRGSSKVSDLESVVFISGRSQLSCAPNG